MTFKEVLQERFSKEFRGLLVSSLIIAVFCFLFALVLVHYWITIPKMMIVIVFMAFLGRTGFYVGLPTEQAKKIWLHPEKKISHLYLARCLLTISAMIPFVLIVISLIYLFGQIYPTETAEMINNSEFVINQEIFIFILLVILQGIITLLYSSAIGAIYAWSSAKTRFVAVLFMIVPNVIQMMIGLFFMILELNFYIAYYLLIIITTSIFLWIFTKYLERSN